MAEANTCLTFNDHFGMLTYKFGSNRMMSFNENDKNK